MSIEEFIINYLLSRGLIMPEDVARDFANMLVYSEVRDDVTISLILDAVDQEQIDEWVKMGDVAGS